MSYEDVSDTDLSPLASCPCLRNLYIDSLIIKTVSREHLSV